MRHKENPIVLRAREGETIAFAVEDGDAYIVAYDGQVFSKSLIRYFESGDELSILYEEMLHEYDDGVGETIVYCKSGYGTEASGWSDYGRTLSCAYLEIVEVTRVERGMR